MKKMDKKRIKNILNEYNFGNNQNYIFGPSEKDYIYSIYMIAGVYKFFLVLLYIFNGIFVMLGLIILPMFIFEFFENPGGHNTLDIGDTLGLSITGLALIFSFYKPFRKIIYYVLAAVLLIWVFLYSWLPIILGVAVIYGINILFTLYKKSHGSQIRDTVYIGKREMYHLILQREVWGVDSPWQSLKGYYFLIKK